LDAFSQGSKKIHIDIDPSSINKNVPVEIPIIGDVAHVLAQVNARLKARGARPDTDALKPWWARIEEWRARKCLSYQGSESVIKPQYALERLYEHIKDTDVYITTEVGQHQMWAAQFLKFDQPNRWMTSGGLGTMGYGLPAAMGAQIAHPDATVIDVAGEASILMNIQELSTIAQYRLPVKVFILNNSYMGMVRQWQEIMHGGRYSESYVDGLPDFVKLAESFGAVGLRASQPAEVDAVIEEMLAAKTAVIVDVVVDQKENCFPMIPSGAAHYDMILGLNDEAPQGTDQGLALV